MLKHSFDYKFIISVMKKITLVFVVLATLFSCKNDIKNNRKAPTIQAIEQKDAFSLTINAIIEKDELFILFFLEDGQENITKKNSVEVKVSGSSDPQELTFKIKEEVLPAKFFLRFWYEEKKQKISFLNTEISYGDNSFIIEKENFFQYFMPNKYIEFDNKNFVAFVKEVDGEYKPRFGSRSVLIDKIFYEF